VANVSLLAEILAALFAVDDADVTIDVRHVIFMDSAAVRVFEHGYTFLRDHDRHLTLTAPSPFIRRVLDLCGASALLELAAPPAALAGLPTRHRHRRGARRASP
jgi:anti-anti-sigma factor